jgi:hypothetical protein
MENKSKKQEAGTVNVKIIRESIKSIELHTSLYKKKRITTEKYIKVLHDSMSKMTTQRDYLEYLKNIGQN